MLLLEVLLLQSSDLTPSLSHSVPCSQEGVQAAFHPLKEEKIAEEEFGVVLDTVDCSLEHRTTLILVAMVPARGEMQTMVPARGGVTLQFVLSILTHAHDEVVHYLRMQSIADEVRRNE